MTYGLSGAIVKIFCAHTRRRLRSRTAPASAGIAADGAAGAIGRTAPTRASPESAGSSTASVKGSGESAGA